MKITKRKLRKIIREELLLEIDPSQIGGPYTDAQTTNQDPERVASRESIPQPRPSTVTYIGWREVGPTAHGFLKLVRTGDKPSWWPVSGNEFFMSGFSERYEEGYDETPLDHIAADAILADYGALAKGINWPNDVRGPPSGLMELPHVTPLTAEGMQDMLWQSYNKYGNTCQYWPAPELGTADQGFRCIGNSNSFIFSVIRDSFGAQYADNIPGVPMWKMFGSDIDVI